MAELCDTCYRFTDRCSGGLQPVMEEGVWVCFLYSPSVAYAEVLKAKLNACRALDRERKVLRVFIERLAKATIVDAGSGERWIPGTWAEDASKMLQALEDE